MTSLLHRKSRLSLRGRLSYYIQNSPISYPGGRVVFFREWLILTHDHLSTAPFSLSYRQWYLIPTSRFQGTYPANNRDMIPVFSG